MQKEKLYVRIISAFLSFIMFLGFIICVNGYNIYSYMLDPHSLVESADTKGLVKAMKKEVFDSQIHPYTQDFKEIEDLYEEAINQEFVDYYLEAMINAAVFGEKTYSSKEMKKLLYESTEDFVDDHEEIPKDKYEEVIDAIVEASDMTVEEAVQVNEDNEYMEVINQTHDMVTLVVLGSLGLILLMAIIQFVIYSDKFRPFVCIGRAAIIAMIFSAAGMFAIKYVLADVLKEADIDYSFLETFIEKFIDSVFMKSLISVGVVFVAGIVFVVIGKIFTGYNKVDTDAAAQL